MERETVNTALLTCCLASLVYIAVVLTYKPSIHEIDGRVHYWFDFYQKSDRHVGRFQRPQVLPTADRLGPGDEFFEPQVNESPAPEEVPEQGEAAEERDQEVGDAQGEPPPGGDSPSVAPTLDDGPPAENGAT
jgi:hypothetical protein